MGLRDFNLTKYMTSKRSFNSQKTVFIISPSLGIGGREKIAINTVTCFKNLNYHVILIVFQRRHEEYEYTGELINLDVSPANGKTGKLLAQCRRSYKLLKLRKKYNTQFVYSLGEAANITNILSGLFHIGKTIISIHGSGEVRKNIINSFMFPKADHIICIAHDMYHRLHSLYPKLENISVIENGYILPTIERYKRSCSSTLHLVSMGRLTHVKGYDRLIRSLRIIRQGRLNTTLTIIGAGEQEEELENLAKQVGVFEAVSFMGFLAEPIPILQEQDIYLLTSYKEGFPNALIEAMNCGLPIVAVDCQTGPREILSAKYSPEPVYGIRHEKYGILVENNAEGFEERFANAVLQLSSNQKEMLAYSKIGIQRAKDFSLEHYQEKLQQLLKE